MKQPNFTQEKKLWRQGFKYVVGLDEAGRGPLAGPVVAAAVSLRNFKFEILNLKSNRNLKKINDSKKLTEPQREEFYEILTNHPAIEWGVGIVSEKVIDGVNILEATKLAMERALKDVLADQSTQIQNLGARPSTLKRCSGFLLIDGNFALKTVIPQRSIVKGDSKVFSIAAASIIAKVTRDRIMRNLHQKYPQYNFAQHKGYGTAAHLASLKAFGPSKIHRKTFYPVSALVKSQDI